jgi:hypothetical protein
MRISPKLTYIAIAAFSATAQTPQPADPTLNTSGLPAYVRLIPTPRPEPWTPITGKERFQDYARLAFGPTAAFGATFGAAISQAKDSPHEWGQGWKGYGTRVASSYGGQLVGNTIEYAASAAFREDNRYFRSQRTTFKGRLGYVLASPFMTNTGPGQRRISASALLGATGSATIPLAWSPASWQGWDSVGMNFLIFYSQRAGLNFARELMPSIARHFRHRKQPAASPTSSR